jgi:AbrB family looped-hinge helix DNA binding protein
MPISKVGQRRQVVIPQDVCDDVGLSEGDFVEVTSARGTVVIKPKKLVDADDILSPDEELTVRKGEQQIRRGQTVMLEELEHGLERHPRKRRRQTV